MPWGGHSSWVWDVLIRAGVLSLALMAIGCVKKAERPDLAQSPTPGSLRPGPNHTLEIHSTDLNNRLFLMQANLVEHNSEAFYTSAFQGLKSKLVYFRRSGSELQMFEHSPDNGVSLGGDPALLLAQFPIVREHGAWLRWDFNSGMREAFNSRDWRGPPIPGQGYQRSDHFSTVKLKVAALRSVEVMDRGFLVIKQFGQTEKAGFVTIHYYLSPYRTNPSYQPLPIKPQHTFGFFSTAPLLAEDAESPNEAPKRSAPVFYATRFDMSKGITFCLSANTPAEYREAIVAGIRYWNLAFSEERIHVQLAPPEMSAPDPRCHMVQWVDNENSVAAYADAQVDPLTGEIRHAQVYLPTYQVLNPLAEFRLYLRRLDREDESGHEERAAALARDYLAYMTAHEVGHILGLSHNFAGNLAANFSTVKDREELERNFLLSGKLPDNLVISSSVMDYFSKKDAAIVGHIVRGGKTILEYDQKAIRALYYGQEFQQTDVPLFCDDLEKEKYLDCRAEDSGASLIEEAVWRFHYAKDTTPFWLVEAAKKNPPEKLDDVLDPAKYLDFLYGDRKRVLLSLTKNRKLLRVRRQLPALLSETEVRKKEQEYLEGEVQKVGGLAEVFASIEESDFDSMRSQALELAPAYLEPVRDIKKFTETLDVFFASLREQSVMVDLDILNQKGEAPTSFERFSLTHELADLFYQRAKNYTLSTQGEAAEGKLPNWRYPYQIRKAAAFLLSRGRYRGGEDYPFWGAAQRMTLKQDFRRLVEPTFSQFISKVVSPDSMLGQADKPSDQKLFDWFLENQEVCLLLSDSGEECWK